MPKLSENTRKVLTRLKSGKRIEKQHRRSTYKWENSEDVVHHLIMKSLMENEFVNQGTEDGFDYFTITDAGIKALSKPKARKK